MPTLAPIRIVIAGIDQFSNKFKKVQRSVDKLGAGLRRAGVGMTAGVTAPALMAGAAIFKAGYQFDKFMNMVEAKSEVSGKSIDQLRVKALELGKSTSFSHIQAAEGMQFLAQAGYNTGEAFDAILPTLKLAQATNIELGQSADFLTNIMGGMGWAAKDGGQAAAILALTTAKANVNMEELAATFSDVGPIAKRYGASLQDVSAATGFLGNIGIKGTKAGTALKTMFINLAAQTPKATKALNSLGIKIADSKGNLRDFKDILKEMSLALPKRTEQQALTALVDIFGKRAVAGTAGIVENLTQTNNKFTELVGTMNKVTESDLTKMVETMRKGSVGAWDDTVSALQGLGQAIADSGVQQFIIETLRGTTALLRKVIEISPWILKAAAAFLAVLAVVGPLMLILSTMISTITGMIAVITTLNTGLLLLEGHALAAGIGLKSMALAALGPLAALAAGLALVAYTWNLVNKEAAKELKEIQESAKIKESSRFQGFMSDKKQDVFKQKGQLQLLKDAGASKQEIEAQKARLENAEIALRTQKRALGLPVEGANPKTAAEIARDATVLRPDGRPGKDGEITLRIPNLPEGFKVDTKGVKLAGDTGAILSGDF